MRKKTIIAAVFLLLLVFAVDHPIRGCSTFKLHKGPVLVYGHNLNQGDIGVPGMVFINKRGVFKQGRTWSEMTTRENLHPSSVRWISLYGSVTFNVFGRDFPDGGMNETGLVIWEMSADSQYPEGDSRPRLNQMMWMQYVLDTCSTVDEMIRSVREIQVEGWGWHQFVGDGRGDCAALAFKDGRPVVYRGASMPVPGLFNTDYDREMEILKYYRGFGGRYQPDLTDPRVPRFVKTAVMARDYEPSRNGVAYGLKMLDTLTVFDVPEWSVLFDVAGGAVYFKTRIHPEIKHFTLDTVDFAVPGLPAVLNMDQVPAGDAGHRFHDYSDPEFRDFLKTSVVPILPKEIFTSGGLTIDEWLDRFSTHSGSAVEQASQFLGGAWKSRSGEGKEKQPVTLVLETENAAVRGTLFTPDTGGEGRSLDHLLLVNDQMSFTIKTAQGVLIEGRASIQKDRMELHLMGIEKDQGRFELVRERKR